MDTIVIMKNGTIFEIGTYDQLTSQLGDFSELVQSDSENNTQEPVKSSQGKYNYTFSVKKQAKDP